MTNRPKKCPKCGGKLEGLRTKCWSGPYGNGCGWKAGDEDTDQRSTAHSGEAVEGSSTDSGTSSLHSGGSSVDSEELRGELRDPAKVSNSRKSLRLILPMPENRANSRWHWRTELRKKKAYWRVCDGWANAYGPHQPDYEGWPGDTPETVKVSVHLYLWNRMDHGNAMARLKWVEDWLVQNGFLIDDSTEHLTYEGMPVQSIDRELQRVELHLEALDMEPETEEAA